MAKRKRRPDTNSALETTAVLAKQPRLDPQARLLSRFFEALVLLYTLGRTRGDRPCATMPPREDLVHLPLKDLRRIFLNELAYMCDYDKGGETVTALGWEFTPERYIFWVGSNAGSKTKTIDFLVSLLTKIIHISTTSSLVEIKAEVASLCIGFATMRIRKYRSHLRPLLRRCISHLTEAQRAVGALVLKSPGVFAILTCTSRAGSSQMAPGLGA
jgi:hypothetical protein